MILLLFAVCCYRPLLKVYETSQLGLIALHIFRVWHGTIRCNRCSSELLLLVDWCVLCSVITVLPAFIARLSVGTAFIARLRLLPAQRSPLVSRWRSSLISFRLDLAFIARSISVSTWRACFICACIGRCRHLVGRWIMLLFSCMHGSLCGRKRWILNCTLVTAVVQCHQWC